MVRASWTVWLIRYVIMAVSAAAIAFAVADYVVDANTSSANEAMRALQSSIDTLNTSVLASTEATNRLQEQMSELLRRSEQHSAGLAALQGDVARVTAAVQNAGIDIRVGAQGAPGMIVDWLEVRDALGVEGAANAYIKLPLGMSDN